MSKVVRKSVFETNSSSTHSINIAEGEFVRDTLAVKDGVCSIEPGEFGWEVEDHNDAATKASYCLTFVKGLADGGEHETVGPSDAQRLEEMLTRVIAKVTGAKAVEFVGTGDKYTNWGYIDHQSDHVCEEAFKDDATLEAFIFNRASTLHTDNDNH